MNLRTLLLLAVFPVLAAGAVSAADGRAGQSRPNVLFIAVDDLRVSLGSYGDPLAKTPHLDRFAAGARQFNRAYTMQAVCGPARTAMLTGRLPDQNRSWHNRNLFRTTNPDTVTLPQLFKQHGYHTESMGKIFSGDERELDPVSWSGPEILRQDGWKNYALPRSEGGGKQAPYEAADVPDDGYPDGRLANLAVETLGRLKAEARPFFLAVGFFKPHLPFNAPKRYWDLHDPAKFDLPNEPQGVQGAPAIAYHSHRELGGYSGMPKDERLDAAQTRTMRHGYHACVSYTDAQIGKVLGELARLGLDRNTIVVVWGDHGYALGDAGRWCKGTNWELDTRAPLLIRTPGLDRPRRGDQRAGGVRRRLSDAGRTGRAAGALLPRGAQPGPDPARPGTGGARVHAVAILPPLQCRAAGGDGVFDSHRHPPLHPLGRLARPPHHRGGALRLHRHRQCRTPLEHVRRTAQCPR
jgi:iduronate 2-sulfatase